MKFTSARAAAILCALIYLAGATSAVAGAPSGGPGRAWTPDPYMDRLWHLDLVHAPEAWKVTEGSGAIIAILDSGVDLDHPDLEGNLTGRGRDFRDPKDMNGAQDEDGHGTHVAGIAAAVAGNGIGVAGVAPEAKILPIRRHSPFYPETFKKELAYAARSGAHVVNMSFSSLPVPPDLDRAALQDAIEFGWKKGLVLVASAGNWTWPFCTPPSSQPRVLCVGATNQLDIKASYSSFDADPARAYVVAPGGETSATHGVSNAYCGAQILSTYHHARDDFPVVFPARSKCSPEEGYDELSGTSMAAPVVSGVAALLASRGLNNEQIVERIMATADDLGAPGWDPVYGYGRVNAVRAATFSG